MYNLPRSFRLRQQNLLLPPYRHTLLRRQQQQHPQHPFRHQSRPFTSLFRRLKPQYVFNRSSGEPYRYQSVRFKKPPYFTWRRAITTSLYAGAIYLYIGLVFRYLDIEVEILDEEDLAQEEAELAKQDRRSGREVRDADAKEEDEDEEGDGPFYADEDSTFIPLTWATKLPRSFYRGSDPEWQEFVKVAKDKARHKKIQDELVAVVYTGAVQHPAISRQLGPDPKVGKYWLDISFPDGPPPEYERSGLEIGDGFVAWSQQKVSQEQQWRVTRALWPAAAVQSLWATGKVLWGMNVRRVRQALGWEGAVDPASPEGRLNAAMEMMAKQQAARERRELPGSGRGGDKPPTPDGLSGGNNVVGGGTSSPGATPPDALPRPTTPSSSSSSSSSTSNNPNKLPWPLTVPLPSTLLSSLSPSSTPTSPNNPNHPGTPSSSPTLPLALHVFNSTLAKSWHPKHAEPPRGSFVVQGLVEVRGKRGRMLFDVQSCYDPRQGKFVVVNAGVRGFKRWRQGPRGGP